MIFFLNSNYPSLLGKKSEGGESFLEVGEHTFPFEFDLPLNLPNSFQHHVGNICYYAKANVDIPWAVDKHCKRPFTVLNNLDLSGSGAYLVGSGASGQRRLCCGPCRSDPIDVSLSMPKSKWGLVV